MKADAMIWACSTRGWTVSYLKNLAVKIWMKETTWSGLRYENDIQVEVKAKIKAVPLHATKTLGERRYSPYSFSTSALDGGECSASCLGERNPGTHCTGGWVGPRACLDTEARGKIRCLYQGSNLDRLVVQLVARHYTDWDTRLTSSGSCVR
jgi:hypothetical protein